MNKEWEYWFAGFFDGEGCVYSTSFWTNGAEYFLLRVSICQSNQKIIEEIAEYFPGGTIRQSNYNCFTVDWTGNTSKKVLLVLEDRCKLKNSQVKLALEYLDVMNSKLLWPEEKHAQRKRLMKQIKKEKR